MSKTYDWYPQPLGQLIANLQSLEFSLRMRLSYDDPQATALPSSIRLQDLKKGDTVPENSLTNYETLGQLIARYNGTLSSADVDCQVDATIVDLRDAVAHGRAAMQTPEADVMLLKFGRPTRGQVLVEYSERLSRDWFTRSINHLLDQVLKVHEAMRRHRERRGVKART